MNSQSRTTENPEQGPVEKHKCHCHREGKLVIQELQPPMQIKKGGPLEHWVFRVYMCRYHLASANRHTLPHCKKLYYLDYIPDETLIAQQNV